MRWIVVAVAAACASLSLFAESHDWPRWLGPTRDAHAPPGSVAPKSLEKEPRQIWRIATGGGFSSPIVIGAKLIYLDEQAGKEIAHCLELQTGKELWSVPYADVYQDEWGAGPRATPFVDGDRVYVQSCNGEFRCLNLADGAVVWGASFSKDFGVRFLGSKANEGTASRRGNNGSGIVDGDAVIVPVGSTDGATLVCFNKLNGKVLWKTGNDEAAYSSVMVAEFDKVKQVVYLSAEALFGADRQTGKILWRQPLVTNAKRHAAAPVIHQDRIYVNSHTFGVICFKIHQQDGEWKADREWQNRDMKINLATPALVDGNLYCQGPAKNFVSINAETGKLNWAHDGYGREYSSTLALPDLLLVLSDEGQLVGVKPNPTEYQEAGRWQICGKNWNFPAYVDGKLYVRDNRSLACFDLMSSK